MNVFLSHSNHKDDLHLIQMLDLSFKTLGLTLHIVERRPKPGKSLGIKIQEIMDACDYVLVLYTHHAADSMDVQAEIGLAKAQNRPHSPIFITEFPTAKSVLVQGCEDFPLDRKNPVASLFPVLAWFKANTATLSLKASQDGEMEYRKPFYFRTANGDGPFCKKCWDDEAKAIRLDGPDGGTKRWDCPKCKNFVRENPDWVDPSLRKTKYQLF